MRTKVKGFGLCILWLVVLFGMTELVVPPASAAPAKTGSTGKTEKQCNADHKVCKKNCEKTIIDIDNQVQQCKDRCTDTMVMCQPAARTPRGEAGPFSGGKLQVAPGNPGTLGTGKSPISKGKNSPIMRRGVEGDQPASSPTEQEEMAPASK